MFADARHGGSQRFGEVGKMLPVTGVFTVLVTLYAQYVLLHCVRLLQLDLPPSSRNQAMVSQGYQQLATFHAITALLLYSLARCILTHPGFIPDGAGWELQAEEDSGAGPKDGQSNFSERKQTTGERRHCKWCLKYKPDRCHHCRICNSCILRMDHHCPWVYNCIGFRNHKYFFLVLIYGAIDLIFMNATMFDSVWWATRTDVSVSVTLAALAGACLASSLMVLIIVFLGFHIWLMLKAMTTLEFCEKYLKKSDYSSSVYSAGYYENICSILGPRPLLWFLPVSFPVGDGLRWKNAVLPTIHSEVQSPHRGSAFTPLRA
mmetsp:Transcript_63340/g.151111  ORF Transcript_63340/g.151111 Transcript_63340/m.151111 type:complete len:319 (-) Transcript_63340:67-1023(-)